MYIVGCLSEHVFFVRNVWSSLDYAEHKFMETDFNCVTHIDEFLTSNFIVFVFS